MMNAHLSSPLKAPDSSFQDMFPMTQTSNFISGLRFLIQKTQMFAVSTSQVVLRITEVISVKFLQKSYVCQICACLVIQSCLTLCDTSVHGILQARILEWLPLL